MLLSNFVRAYTFNVLTEANASVEFCSGGSQNKYSLLRRSLLQIFAFGDCPALSDLLLHHSADFERETEQGNEALSVLVVVKLACCERSDILVVEAVF